MRATSILIGSVLIEPREAFLEMLHPVFTKILAELAKLDHLPLVASLVK